MRIAIIIVAALIARATMAAIIYPSMGGDDAYYFEIARGDWDTLLGGYRPPGYPLAIWPFVRLGTVELIYVAQAALTISLGIFVTQWTKSFWAGLLIVTSPFFIVYEVLVLAEILTITMLTIGWLILSRPGVRHASVAGVFLALASLSRDTLAALPLFALPFGYFLRRTRDFAIAAGIVLIVCVPWALHSARSEGRFGYNLWVGTWERNGEWVKNGVPKADYPDYAFQTPAERILLLRGASDSVYLSAALDRMRRDPLFVVGNWVARYPQLWIGTRTEHSALRLPRGSASWLAFKSAMWALNLFILAAGLWAIGRRPFLAIPILYVALIYIPFHNVETRYSLIVLPLFMIALGLAANELNIRLMGFRFRNIERPARLEKSCSKSHPSP